MNFSQLQCLVAIADTGSFTEAAYTIHLTQSAVSHALAVLENELGMTLLERNRKGVIALTSFGQKIIPHARVLLAQIEAIEQEAKAAHGVTMGKLRVGSLPIFSPDLLAGTLTRFQQLHPDMEVVLFEGMMQEVLEWIEHSIVDVGFVLHPTTEIESTYILTDELCVIVPLTHHLRTRAAVTPGELREEERFIIPKTGCAFMEMIGLTPSRTGAHIRYHASDSTTILAMVREGLGITLVPRMMLPEKLEGVAAIPLDPAQQLHVGLAVASDERASPGAKLFVQTALSWTQECELKRVAAR